MSQNMTKLMAKKKKEKAMHKDSATVMWEHSPSVWNKGLSTGKKSSIQENCISAPVIDLVAAERQEKNMGESKKKRQENKWHVFFDYLKYLVFCDLEK